MARSRLDSLALSDGSLRHTVIVDLPSSVSHSSSSSCLAVALDAGLAPDLPQQRGERGIQRPAPGIRSTSPALATISNSIAALGASCGTLPNRQWYSVAPSEYISDLNP